ncbi:MAG: hypothetical protein JSU86_01740 [Phycisphaerales bacterium]|nr:MAG: hypothetical protein JSU86_01740 [Phycisphaerales bacterium]
MNFKEPLATTVACLLLWPAIAMAQQPPDAQSRYMPTGPAPEEGYQPYDIAVRERGQKVIANVPGYLWRHGCGPTAAGMVVGYWDGQEMPLLMPGAAGTQTNAVDQAIATGDGANTHYSDYSLPIDDPIDGQGNDTGLLLDLSEPPPGDEHASDSLADFMETSWSSRDNYYGWSWFSDVDNSLLGYVGYANATYSANYQASSWNEQWGAFTWAKFCTEINADRPMVFLVDSDGDGYTDHFVTAIGWRDTQGFNEYACFDTWAPGGNVRWERFREMSNNYDWGIYGATYFVPTISPIPTVSEWGLIVMTLLLLTVGKIVFYRKRGREAAVA